jgi:hypothetical protein
MSFEKENLVRFCWRTKNGEYFREHHGYLGIYKIFTILEGLKDDYINGMLILKPSLINTDSIPFGELDTAKDEAEQLFLEFINYSVVNKKCYEETRYTETHN